MTGVDEQGYLARDTDCLMMKLVSMIGWDPRCVLSFLAVLFVSRVSFKRKVYIFSFSKPEEVEYGCGGI